MWLLDFQFIWQKYLSPLVLQCSWFEVCKESLRQFSRSLFFENPILSVVIPEELAS